MKRTQNWYTQEQVLKGLEEPPAPERIDKRFGRPSKIRNITKAFVQAALGVALGVFVVNGIVVIARAGWDIMGKAFSYLYQFSLIQF